MKDGVVIFGASGGAVKVIKTLKNLGIIIQFLVDNDTNKHGKMVEGLAVKSPDVLLDSGAAYKIIIASMYHGEIKEQLLQMGIGIENIRLKEEYILEYIDIHRNDFFYPKVTMSGTDIHDNIIIDLSEGIILGGIEKWGITLAEGLREQKRKVKIFTVKDERNMDIKGEISYFDLSYERYIDSVKELVGAVIAQLPCTIVINRINQIFMAAYIVKRYFSDEIKIISVLHSDFSRMYEQNLLVQDSLDVILCVSKDVACNAIHLYNLESKKVHFKDSPIIYEEKFEKKYSKETEPIVIGYAARLEKSQKRADLLIPLIEKLEEYRLNYILFVAGGGSFFNSIYEYIRKHLLEHKVILCGIIPFNEMSCFWKQCDICINLSDIEGIGLSMLEAMALGVVPVVTDTAGASDFITNGENGYINNLRDVEGIAKDIYGLSIERNKLHKFGDKSREIIKRKCNLREYIEYIGKLLKS